MIKKLTYIFIATSLALSFIAGWFARPVVQSAKESIETIEMVDGKTTKIIKTKKSTPSVPPVSAYMPKYSVGAQTGFQHQRFEIGFRLLGNLWVTGGFSPKTGQYEVGLRIDF